MAEPLWLETRGDMSMGVLLELQAARLPPQPTGTFHCKLKRLTSLTCHQPLPLLALPILGSQSGPPLFSPTVGAARDLPSALQLLLLNF